VPSIRPVIEIPVGTAGGSDFAVFETLRCFHSHLHTWMDRRSFCGQLATALLASACGGQGDGPPTEPPPTPRRLLVLTETAGYRHESIPTAVRTLGELGVETGRWQVAAEAGTPEQVAAAVTAAGLAQVDGVVFANTTGTLGFTPEGSEAFYRWIEAGGAYVGIHSASDTFHGDPRYLGLVRGEFATHGPETEVEVHVQDAAHPACAALPATFGIYDEIYEFQNWSRASVHVLLSMHTHPQTGAPGDFPLAWTVRSGSGRMFYTALGHRDEVYANPLYRAHLRGGIEWALGLRPGDDTPGNPIV
jgi:uncharacterized protein